MLELIMGAIALVLGFGLKWLASRFSASKATQDANEALLLGVAHVQSTYTEAIKDASADGTLTDEEAKKAKEDAISKAKELCTKEGLQLLESWGKDKLGAIVEILLTKLKGK